MNHFFRVLILFSFVYTSGCDSTSNEFKDPYLEPDEVTVLIQNYIQAEQSLIKLDKYYLESLSYDYSKRRWAANYMCHEGPMPPGCHFAVYMSDSRSTKFQFWGGM